MELVTIKLMVFAKQATWFHQLTLIAPLILDALSVIAQCIFELTFQSSATVFKSAARFLMVCASFTWTIDKTADSIVHS